MTKNYFSKNTSLGYITVYSEDNCITGIHFEKRDGGVENKLIKEVFTQLNEYFDGKRKEFDFPKKLYGTKFQLKVWDELSKIPYGTSISYKELAERTGYKNGYRAVGNANGKNPMAIVIPCHRVIANDNTVGGYNAGLNTKIKLLKLESIPWKEA